MIPMDDRECVVEQCMNCNRKTQMMWKLGAPVTVCSTYLKPRVWWNRGGCPFMYKPESTVDGKSRVGQQKQKKRR